MKKTLSISLALMLALFGQSAFSCDEKCQKEKAEKKHNVTFPAYLSWKYCEGIAVDFMTSAVRSLDSYRTNHFNTKFKGPLRNTRSYLTDRKDWLKECDQYMALTKASRIFNDDKTTKQIFASIDNVEGEFTALINGATYASEDEAKAVMDQKMNALLKQVEDHKTIMHLKGKFVLR